MTKVGQGKVTKIPKQTDWSISKGKTKFVIGYTDHPS